MILKDDFYVLTEMSVGEKEITGKVRIDPEHHIFNGHFPESPVVPGVCMMQMLMELAEEARNVKLRLSEGKSVKFMNIINPNENPEVYLKHEISSENEEKITVKSTIFNQQKVFLKFAGTFSATVI